MIENLAVLPGSGGINRLTRIVGPHWARWLAMAAENVDAGQALSIGLVRELQSVIQPRRRTVSSRISEIRSKSPSTCTTPSPWWSAVSAIRRSGMGVRCHMP